MSDRQRLSNRRGSVVITFEFEGMRYRSTASRFPDGRLAEIFLDSGKAGSTVQRYADDVAVLVSLLLQHGVDVETVRHSIAGPIGTALDLIARSS